jgi:uncharacterized protein YbbC (DUF1343 family)
VKVRTGLDRLLAPAADGAELRGALRGRPYGLLVNQASVTSDLRHAIDALRDAGLPPTRLFAPEHGVRGHAQDMESVGDEARDPVTGLPAVSLYGDDLASLAPEPAALDGLDVVLVDLPDIGTRYYTFAATGHYLARTAHAVGVDVWVLDRPNPIGGVAVEGNLVAPGFESFVGAISLPNRHGLTLGELLRYADAHTAPAPVRVIEAAGWARPEWLDDTGLPWVLPSPNMPNLEAAAIYPGMCLLEATNISEARGTTRPFELFGAPFVDSVALVRALRALDLPGVRFREAVFKPGFQKWAGAVCHGAQVHIVDRQALRPYALGLAVLSVLWRLYPGLAAWRDKPYEFVDDIPAIDLLAGCADVRLAIEAGAELDELVAVACAGADDYAERRRAVALYPLAP